METMRINISNVPKIEAAIQSAEGRAKARRLSFADLSAAANAAEKKMDALKIKKSNRAGCIVRILPERVANSYNYRAEGTAATLERGGKDWYMIYVFRTTCGNTSHGDCGRTYLVLTDTAHADIPKNWEV